MVWLTSGGRVSECPLCIDEHANPRNPNFQAADPLRSSPSTAYPLPCPKHGDPRICLPGNQEAIDVFLLLANQDNFVYRERAQGDKRIMKRYLDLSICAELCKAKGLDVWSTLEKLSICLEEYNG